MRRLGVIVAIGALLGMLGGVLTGSPALAGRGPKWQFEQAQPFTLPAAFCGFPIRVTPVADKGYTKILKASDGTMTFLTTGTLKIAYTNLNTGKAITENVSGPAKNTVFPDGSAIAAVKGHSANFLSPADAQRFGLPAVSVTSGALTFHFAPDGSITSLTLHGHLLVNVCAALS